MAEEQASTLPEGLEQWLDDRTTATDRDREEVLARAVATYRLLSEGDETLSGDEPPVDQQLTELTQRLDELDARADERIEDVRDRVVQVLKTAESKDHPALDARIQSVGDDLDGLEERVDDGFENYEAILSSLTDRADEIDGKLDALAGAVVDLRKRALELESANARRNAVEELQVDAGLRGISAADCEACGETVRIGLLAEPQCPYCREPFGGVEPGGGFLRSATLVVGDRPALAGDAFEPEEPEEVFEENE